MSINVHTAQTECLTRPNDEKFFGITDMMAAAKAEQAISFERTLTAGDVVYRPENGEVAVYVAGERLLLSHSAMLQACAMAGVGPTVFTGLTLPTVATVLNEKWASNVDPANELKALVRQPNGVAKLRSLNGPGYGRLFTGPTLETVAEIAERYKLRTPPAWAWTSPGDPRHRVATPEDCGAFTLVKPGELIGPGGAYYSPLQPQDTLIYLVSDVAITLPNGSTGFRFAIIKQSETGYGALHILTGIMDKTCGNHAIFNPRELSRHRVIHRGSKVAERLEDKLSAVRAMLEASTTDEENALARSAGWILGTNDKEATAKAASLTGISGLTIRKALDRIPSQDYGNPLSAYRYASILTEYSQTLSHAVDRAEMDEAAGVLYAGQ